MQESFESENVQKGKVKKEKARTGINDRVININSILNELKIFDLNEKSVLNSNYSNV